MNAPRAIEIAEFLEGADRASYEDYLSAWQLLVDTGLAWQLQGYYARTAIDLIQAGEITVKTKETNA